MQEVFRMYILLRSLCLVWWSNVSILYDGSWVWTLETPPYEKLRIMMLTLGPFRLMLYVHWNDFIMLWFIALTVYFLFFSSIWRSPLPESIKSTLEEGINLYRLHFNRHGRLVPLLSVLVKFLLSYLVRFFAK